MLTMDFVPKKKNLTSITAAPLDNSTRMRHDTNFGEFPAKSLMDRVLIHLSVFEIFNIMILCRLNDLEYGYSHDLQGALYDKIKPN